LKQQTEGGKLRNEKVPGLDDSPNGKRNNSVGWAFQSGSGEDMSKSNSLSDMDPY